MKSLAFLMILGLLTLLPAGVLAQQSDPPHQFFGTVLLADGSVTPDGIVVAAIVDGQMVATATVESGFQPGFYLLKVAPPGRSIICRPDGVLYHRRQGGD